MKGERKPEEGRGRQEGGSRTSSASKEGLKEVSRRDLSETGGIVSVTH